MTSDGHGAPVRRTAPRRAALAGFYILAGLAAAPAAAQQTEIQKTEAPETELREPLFLRIRARPDAEAARTAREAVWARSQARARAVIASVCTGCLSPWRDAGPVAPPETGQPETRMAALPERGLEADPSLEASDPTSEPPTRERRP